jgi:hypothetical protein
MLIKGLNKIGFGVKAGSQMLASCFSSDSSSQLRKHWLGDEAPVPYLRVLQIQSAFNKATKKP